MGTPVAVAAPPTEAPQGFEVLAADARFIDLAWDPPSDPLLVTELSVAVPPLPAYTEVLASGQTDAVAEVTCGRTYAFTVRFRNALGETGPPAQLAQASEPCSPGAPPAPTGLRVTGSTGGSVALAWDAPAANDVETIRVMAVAAVAASAEDLPFYAEDHIVNGLTCGSSYAFELSFIAYDGQESAHSSTSATTVDCALVGPPLAPPTQLRLVGPLGPMVKIAWDPAPDPEAVATFSWITPNGTESYGGASSPVTRQTAACGAHAAEVTWRVPDGRVSPPARLALAIPPCPRPARTVGLTPYAAPRPTGDPVAILLRVPAQRRSISPTAAGRFTLRGGLVRCPPTGGACTLAVRVLHQRSRAVLGVQRLSVAQGARVPLNGRLSTAGRRALRRAGRLRVAIEIEATQEVGNDVADVHATLVAPKSRSR